ncbi:hypothetical protein ACR788_23815 [Sphingobacterium siyangense]|uniref:hypothetical protein n=1 Tax=Sphingobacterium TaxID=28453 RepID=UPI00191855C2|nr:hypothetical protein [Sphingobacterium multivorum]QQT60096.1 hypothetical protein I6I97_12550 [Sphingobacterium multivorum]
MDEISIKKSAIKTFLDEQETIEIPVLPKTKFDSFLQKIGIKKKLLKYNLRKLRVGNRERIAVRLFDFPDQIMNNTVLIKRVFELTKERHQDMIYCAAVALQNDRNEPSKELIDAINWVSEETFQYIFEKALGQLDIENFLKSIVMLTGTASLIKAENQQASLSDSGGIIAPGTE